jgi:transposase
MRVLTVARRSARDQRIQTLNQIRHLVFTAPEAIRQRFLGRYHKGMLTEMAALRPRKSSLEAVSYVTLVTLRNLARRIRALDTETVAIRHRLHQLVTEVAPSMLDIHGLRAGGAAILLVAAGDNPERLRSEAAWAHLCGVAPIPASSGKTIRHRLNRGGNRYANSVLYQIVISRMSSDARTRRYVTRRREEGRTTGEIVRILKRYVAREVYKLLPQQHN